MSSDGHLSPCRAAPADIDAVEPPPAPPRRKNTLINNPHRMATRAAMTGRLSVLKHMEQTGIEWRHVDVCAAAAMKGHLHVLKWARAHGCDWDDRVCDLSDANGWPLKVAPRCRCRHRRQ